MILFSVENRVSLLGKNRMWKSEWLPSVSNPFPDAVPYVWVNKRGSTYPIPTGTVLGFCCWDKYLRLVNL
jgi:hypothetical protein